MLINSNENKSLLSINNKPQVASQKDVIIVYNQSASTYYCFRSIVLLIILISIIVGIVLIIKRTS